MPSTAGIVLCLVKALLKSWQLNVKLLLPVWAWNAEVKTWHLSAGLANSVEVLYFTTELHTSSVRVESSQGQNIYMDKISRNVCGLAVAFWSWWFHRHIHYSSGFSPPQAALHIILSNEGDAVYIDKYVSASSPMGAVVTNDWCIISHLLTRIRAELWPYKCPGIAKREKSIFPLYPAGS